MKKQIAITAMSLACGHAMAQSSVTLYGVMDEAIRYQNNQNSATAHGSSIGMAEGAISGSRWGLKGVEDLGAARKRSSGWKAATTCRAASSINRARSLAVLPGWGFRNPPTVR